MRILTLRSQPITRFGSEGVTMDFVPPIAGRVAGRIARIAAGGRIGAPPAVPRQLLALVAGSAEVEADGETVRIGAGQAVLWEPGEVHETRALDDVLALVVEFDGELENDDTPATP